MPTTPAATDPPSSIRSRLRTALDQALRARDRAAVSVLRPTLAAIDNAEAVAPLAPRATDSEMVAGAVDGLGATEAPRRSLSEDEMTSIVAAEITEQLEAADTYDAAGRPDRAGSLRAGAAVLRALLPEPGTGDEVTVTLIERLDT